MFLLNRNGVREPITEITQDGVTSFVDPHGNVLASFAVPDCELCHDGILVECDEQCPACGRGQAEF